MSAGFQVHFALNSAFARIAAYASDLVIEPQVKAALPWVPQAAWLLSAALLLLSVRRR